jgi:hypothetical protein
MAGEITRGKSQLQDFLRFAPCSSSVDRSTIASLREAGFLQWLHRADSLQAPWLFLHLGSLCDSSPTMADRMRSGDASPLPAQLVDGGKHAAVERDLFAKLAKSTVCTAVATQQLEMPPTGVLVFNLSRPSRSRKSRHLANAKVRRIASRTNHDYRRPTLMTRSILDHN